MTRQSPYIRWVRRPLWVIFGISTGLFLFSLAFTVSWYAPSWRITLNLGTIVVEQGVRCSPTGLHVGVFEAFGPMMVGRAAATGWYARQQYNFYWLMYASCFLLLVLPGPRPEDPTPRCRSCSYDLTGNTSGVCPECGQKV